MAKIKLNINLRRDEQQKGIWQFSQYLTPLEDQFKLSLAEGETGQVEFRGDLTLKREDQNPTGSLKDRGMAYLVSRAWSEGRKELVISSSGNAAISAASYCRLAQIKLHAFISKKIPEGKLEALSASGTILHFSPRPVSEAVKFASQKGLLNLRPSQNPFGSEGYQTIAFEILESLGMIEDIFVPVSSGSALLGIALGFQKFGLMPRLHLCQSTAICPLARLFDSNYEEEEESLAKALVARAVPLKSQLVKFVKGSEGSGWVISNEEIKKAQLQLKEKEIETSAEGALALAAHNKAKKAGFNLGKTVVLLTGKKY